MKGIERQILMNEIQLLLAEKRTSLATLRTGIAVFVLPLSVLTILISTSKYYNVWDVSPFLFSIISICIFLVGLAIYLIFRAMRKIRDFDVKIETIRKKDKAIDSLLKL